VDAGAPTVDHSSSWGHEDPNAPRSAEGDHPSPEPTGVDEESLVSGVLRWLLSETEAEAAAYLCLQPGGGELLRVEPRGLPSQDVEFLVRQVRHAILRGGPEEQLNEPLSLERWLGTGGSKVVLLRGVAAKAGTDALRFARFVIEWLSAAQAGEVPPSIEQRVRMVPGVAWAEADEVDPARVRVLFARDADPAIIRKAIDLAAGASEVQVEELEKAMRAEEPRARLVDLSVSDDEHPSVDVVIDWKGRRLRGRGHGRSTAGGRSYASAEAVADAMKPLLDAAVTIEGLYQADSSDGLNVLVASVRVGRDHYVGAVVSPSGEEEISGARAVLDALNRRLPHIAGKAGRI
jgi:hypothetical protein